MEKLIDLLNEFHFFNTEYIGYYLDKEENRIYFKTEVIDKGITNEERISNERLISKQFGFIKWLVDNDKIDFRKLDPKINDSIPTRYYLGTYIRYSFDKEILMTLSISDTPIEDLVSLLK